MTSWTSRTSLLSCLSLRWRSCSCSQLSSSPTTRRAPVQVNKPQRDRGTKAHFNTRKLLFYDPCHQSCSFLACLHTTGSETQKPRKTCRVGAAQVSLFIHTKINKPIKITYGVISCLLMWTGGGDDLLGSVLNFLHSMVVLRVTEAEYALLTATALLCSGHSSSSTFQLFLMISSKSIQPPGEKQTLNDFSENC